MTEVPTENIESAASRLAGDSNGQRTQDQLLLEKIPADIQSAVLEFRKNWRALIAGKIKEPLHARIRSAVTEHDNLLSKLERAAQDDGGLSSEVCNSYVQGVNSSVLGPIIQFFRDENVAEITGDSFQSGLTQLAKLGEKYPSELVVAETKEIFKPSPSDTWPVAMRKAGARFKRSLSRRKTRMRRIPVFALLQYHLNRRLPIIASPLHDDFQESIAQIVATLESAASKWTHSALSEARRVKQREIASSQDDNESENVEQESTNQSADTLLAVGNELKRALLLLEDQCENLDREKEAIDVKFEMVQSLLESDLRDVGTFLLSISDRRLKKGEYQAVSILRSKKETWKAWHQKAQDRFTLIDRLFAIRATIYQLSDRVLTRALNASLKPTNSSFDRIGEQIGLAKEQLEAQPDGASSDVLSGVFDDLHGKLNKQFDRLISDLPGVVSTDNALSEPGSDEWKAFGRFVDTLPQVLTVHPLKQDEAVVDPLLLDREIEFRAAVRSVMYESMAKHLRPRAASLQQQLVQAWTELEQVRHISLFNLEAAKAELHDETVAEGEEARTPDERRSAAIELAIVGMERALTTLDEVTARLDEPWSAFEQKVKKEFFDEWNAVHVRLRTLDQAAGRIADFSSRFVRFRERTAASIAAGWAAWRRDVVDANRNFGQRIRGLIRKGRTAVGAAQDDLEARSQTVDAISSVAEFKSTLPLVYRRLFSFDELDDASLLEGRQNDLEWAKNHYERWQSGNHVGLAVVVGMPGSGRTSFLNALASSVFENARVHKISFQDRVEIEATLIRLLAESAGLTNSVSSFAELESELQAHAGDDRPIYIIDNVEHLMLNCARGRDLIEAFLLFLSRSDSQICWIMSVSEPAWKYLRKTAPAAVGFAASHHLSKLNRESYESLIMNRHRRSGMPFKFEAPEAGTALSLQRLRKASTDEEKQDILRETFFERLSRLSGQNVMLGLFYWLRSADFDSEEGVLTVKPLAPLYFDFLNKLDQSLAFTLRAMLVHNTLSLDEHNRIFRMDDDQSTFILDTLLNGGLIHSSAIALDRTKSFDRNFFDPNQRYRIHPLVINNVVSFLRGRNILH